mmetsp:Transcript_130916/g.231368  ORF Transcript_130916/g.231368 Transcript_130916/m.231368 type:complete len:261 (-) Transcript_130916:161-943(-)
MLDTRTDLLGDVLLCFINIHCGTGCDLLSKALHILQSHQLDARPRKTPRRTDQFLVVIFKTDRACRQDKDDRVVCTHQINDRQQVQAAHETRNGRGIGNEILHVGHEAAGGGHAVNLAILHQLHNTSIQVFHDRVAVVDVLHSNLSTSVYPRFRAAWLARPRLVLWSPTAIGDEYVAGITLTSFDLDDTFLFEHWHAGTWILEAILANRECVALWTLVEDLVASLFPSCLTRSITQHCLLRIFWCGVVGTIEAHNANPAT